MQKTVRNIGKFLALVLRHQPGVIGLELDREGWVDVETLITGARKKGIDLDRETLNRVVETDAKGRYQFSPKGDKVRACQGHSLPVDLGLQPVCPRSICTMGLRKGFSRPFSSGDWSKATGQYVHFSQDRKTAEIVGNRRGPGLVLKILAKEMGENGHHFYLADNGVWLTGHVPVEYIQPVSRKG